MTLLGSSGGPLVRVAIVGLGAIGREVLKAVTARPGLSLVAVADPAPALVGKDAGEIAGAVAAASFAVRSATWAWRAAVCLPAASSWALRPSRSAVMAVSCVFVVSSSAFDWSQPAAPARTRTDRIIIRFMACMAISL